MENKALQTVEKYNMLAPGDCVVIGLSGGADSCALLSFLLSLRERMSLSLIACHVNHMLRGSEADRDEQFVRQLCAENDVSFELLRIDVASEAARRHESTEKTGRDIRYKFFEKVAAEHNARIATAHTASDNAETVLFNLARGAGLRGLCGIPPVRGMVIRPLICVTRGEIEDYCRKKNIDYVTDSTNLTDEYNRNRLRHGAVPVMKAINPSFEDTVLRMTDVLRRTVDTLEKIAKEFLNNAKFRNGYKAEMLNTLDDTMLSEVIMILCREHGIISEAKHIQLIKEIIRTQGAVELKKDVFAVSKQGFLRIIEKEETRQSAPVSFKDQDLIVINNKKYSLNKFNLEKVNNREKNNKNVFDNSLDYDTIPLTGVFRCRKSGDVFRPAGRGLTKSVRRLFIEMKIPAEQRDRIVMLADGSNVLWIEGIGTAECCCVTEGTKKILTIVPEDKTN